MENKEYSGCEQFRVVLAPISPPLSLALFEGHLGLRNCVIILHRYSPSYARSSKVYLSLSPFEIRKNYFYIYCPKLCVFASLTTQLLYHRLLTVCRICRAQFISNEFSHLLVKRIIYRSLRFLSNDSVLDSLATQLTVILCKKGMR